MFEFQVLSEMGLESQLMQTLLVMGFLCLSSRLFLQIADWRISHYWRKSFGSKCVPTWTPKARILLVVLPAICLLGMRMLNYLVRTDREAILWGFISIINWYIIWDYYRVIGVSMYNHHTSIMYEHTIDSQARIVEDVTSVNLETGTDMPEVISEVSSKVSSGLSQVRSRGSIQTLIEYVVQILGFAGSVCLGYLTLPRTEILTKSFYSVVQIGVVLCMCGGLGLQYYWGAKYGLRFGEHDKD